MRRVHLVDRSSRASYPPLENVPLTGLDFSALVLGLRRKRAMDLLTPTANSSQEEVATNLEELDGFKQYLRRVRKSGSNRALFSHQSDLRYRSLSPR